MMRYLIFAAAAVLVLHTQLARSVARSVATSLLEEVQYSMKARDMFYVKEAALSTVKGNDRTPLWDRGRLFFEILVLTQEHGKMRINLWTPVEVQMRVSGGTSDALPNLGETDKEKLLVTFSPPDEVQIGLGDKQDAFQELQKLRDSFEMNIELSNREVRDILGSYKILYAYNTGTNRWKCLSQKRLGDFEKIFPYNILLFDKHDLAENYCAKGRWKSHQNIVPKSAMEHMRPMSRWKRFTTNYPYFGYRLYPGKLVADEEYYKSSK